MSLDAPFVSSLTSQAYDPWRMYVHLMITWVTSEHSMSYWYIYISLCHRLSHWENNIVLCFFTWGNMFLYLLFLEFLVLLETVKELVWLAFCSYNICSHNMSDMKTKSDSETYQIIGWKCWGGTSAPPHPFCTCSCGCVKSQMLYIQ